MHVCVWCVCGVYACVCGVCMHVCMCVCVCVHVCGVCMHVWCVCIHVWCVCMCVIVCVWCVLCVCGVIVCVVFDKESLNAHHRYASVYLLEVTTVHMMVSQGIKASPVGQLHGSITLNQDVGKHNTCSPNTLLYRVAAVIFEV